MDSLDIIQVTLRAVLLAFFAFVLWDETTNWSWLIMSIFWLVLAMGDVLMYLDRRRRGF